MSQNRISRLRLILCQIGLAWVLLVSACTGLWGRSSPSLPSNAPAASPTLTPFQPEGFVPPLGTPNDNAPAASPTFEASPTPSPTATLPPALWISAAVPDVLRQAALASGYVLAESSSTASAHLVLIDPQHLISNQQSTISDWFYALVTPFPTIPDGVSLADLRNCWSGNPSGPFAGRVLWLDAPTLAAFTFLWGAPAPGSVQVANLSQLVDLAWMDRPSWALIPFEAIEPRWKVLTVDGQSPVHNDFAAGSYPLQVNFGLDGASIPLPSTNRDPARLTVLAMTGTTALVRATADRMEAHGVLYPGQLVRTVLRGADITHVSNEVSFDPNCPTPDPWTASLRFCSNPRYLALLQDVGVKVVELTGNHLLDYGYQDMLDTLDMYDAVGMKVFGGGRNLQSALQPLLLEDHGNKLAFIGCNFAGPPSDWATASLPGSAPCNLDDMASRITTLRLQGYLPIMTFQYSEYYQPNPTPEEELNFRKMAQAGAVIASGSQAHMPASMEFDGGSFIHYGLGNLFFDQMSHEMTDGTIIYDTRNVFIDRHIFYAGRYLGTELLTYIIEDYSRPRPMTDAERTSFLRHIFSVAGW